MIRFVLGPDRLVVPDLAARLPGRGFWLCPRADVVEAASTRGAFARAARGPVSLPPDLVALIRSGLTRRVIDALGLARRAGQAVSGFVKVREALAHGRAGLVVHASDGSEEECHRLLSGMRDLTVVRPLPAHDLGVVFGRDHVVHVAISPVRLAAALEAEAFRLAGMNGPVAPAKGQTNTQPKADAKAGAAGGETKGSRRERSAGLTIERTGE